MKPLWTKPFALLTLATFFLFGSFYLLLPSIPLYVQALGGQESQVGLIVGLFTLTAVVVRPFIGNMLDRRGRKGFVLSGLIVFGLAMLAHTWAQVLAVLVVLRIVHGVSWAVSTTALATAVTDQIPEGRLGEGMSWYGLASTMAMALGPLVAVWSLERYAYQGVFFLGTAIMIGSFLCAAWVRLPFSRPTETEAQPLFVPELFPLATVVFFFAVVYAGITTFLPLFSASIGVNPGLFFSVYAVCLAMVRFVSGRIADRHGQEKVILPGLLLAVVTTIILAVTRGLFGVVVSAIVFGIGFGSAQPILQAAIVGLVRPHQRGIANATFITAFDLGIGLGSIMLGWIVQWLGYPSLFATTAGAGTASFVLYALEVRRRRLADGTAEAVEEM